MFVRPGGIIASGPIGPKSPSLPLTRPPSDSPMPAQILAIARNTFIESIRQPIFFVLVMLSGILQFFTTWGTGFAMGYTESGEVSGDDKLQFDVGLSTVFVCGMLLAALTATAVISREIENKTVLTVVSKPVARPSVVLGKYLGVAGALLIAIIPMVIFLLMGIRHGVMSTASDDPDGPVLLFTFLAIFIALGTAVWCNFFYGWYFSQTCMLILAPAIFLAFILVLCLSKKWTWQGPLTDLKPQICFACFSMATGIFVLAAVATAVSTRLSQVMTTTVCIGVFLFGLMSNYLVGKNVFDNKQAAIIKFAVPLDEVKPGWAEPGSTYKITTLSAMKIAVRPGDSFYYADSPTGFPMLVPTFPKVDAKADLSSNLSPHPALVVTQADGMGITVKRIGEGPFAIERPPRTGDSIFIRPTRVNLIPLAIWSITPNLHYFWLVDAVSQNQLIPFTHIGLVLLYAFAQIGAFLALGVALFQRRDVG